MMRFGASSRATATLCFVVACGQVRDDLGENQSRPGGASADGGKGAGGNPNDADAGAALAGASGRGGAANGAAPGRGGNGASTGGNGTNAGGSGASAGGSTSNTGGNAGMTGTGGTTSIDAGPASGGVPGGHDDVFKKPTVWIGQVDPSVSYPAVVTDAGQLPEKVVLVLDMIVNAVVTGTITFGEGTKPTPENISTLYPKAFAENWQYSPAPAFPYSIVASELKDNRLAIFFAPAELAAPCPNPGPCGSSSQPNLRKVDLLIDGETMAGEISRPPGNFLGGVPEIRLKRYQ